MTRSTFTGQISNGTYNDTRTYFDIKACDQATQTLVFPVMGGDMMLPEGKKVHY